TGHKPAKSEVDVPIIYADYYFLEALLRSKKYR
ncbi:MAG: glucuronyl hydrolase, partial [Flaviaesturariibacter sp.]|nr:glucuronyl hydrolase [Flaviaesturariibacter sp.]